MWGKKLIVFPLLFLMLATAAKKIDFTIDWDRYVSDIQDEGVLVGGVLVLNSWLENTYHSMELIEESITWVEVHDSTTTQILKKYDGNNGVQLNIYKSMGKSVLHASFVPFKFSEGGFYRLEGFSVLLEQNLLKSAKSMTNVPVNSVLSTGKWVKISVKEQGVNKISYDKLREWGITSPENVAIYGNGGYMLPKMNNVSYPYDLEKNHVWHGNDAGGKACVFFYAPGTVRLVYNNSTQLFEHQINLYSELSYYYITSDGSKSPSVESKPVIDGLPDASFDYYHAFAFIEKETNSLIKSGRDFYGDILRPANNITYALSIQNVIPDRPAFVTVAAAARCSQSSQLDIYANGVFKDPLLFSAVNIASNYDNFAMRNKKTVPFTAKEKSEFRLGYASTESSGQAWVDYVAMNVSAWLRYTDGSLNFRNSDVLAYDIVSYSIDGIPNDGMVWDVTNPLAPERIQGTVQNGKFVFNTPGRKISEFLVFNPKSASIPEPTFVENVTNQNIKGSQAVDMIIVTHPDFLSAANRLAEHRRNNDGLKILVVTINEVYNEFSSGATDVAAIRNMARYFYHHKSDQLHSFKYLLLMGDGHYNNRNTTKSLIPTYQSVNSLHKTNSFVSDDFFGLLDENEGEVAGYLDIGVGRLTCKTIREADAIVNKIIRYDSPEARGPWRNRILFLADDEDSNLHMRDTERLIKTISSVYPKLHFDKVYFDAYQQIRTSAGQRYPDVTDAINLRMRDGLLIFNYVGHANANSIADEDVLKINHINAWSNAMHLPVFVTATCNFSEFDGDGDSAGEAVLANPNGGGVALFSTTRIVFSNANYALTTNFYRSVFEYDDNGQKLRLGEIMRRAKINTLDNTNKLNFVLLADPSMRLSFPEYNVNTISVNGKLMSEDTVAVGALEKVTFEGEVADHDNLRMTDFNGQVTTMIYDKAMAVQTLANDGGVPFEYVDQNRLIYKGVSTVQNGLFKFSFVVPKDISYQIGNGKILYYAIGENIDANGIDDQILIGGTGSEPIIENDPPVVKLFLNDENFKPYGKVASNSLLIVKLSDETGINTVGAGIGHDLIAILNDDFANPIVLNDYYMAKENSYQEGTIIYPLNNLAPGVHKIMVKAWDVQNNSTQAETHFVVEEGFEIISIGNFPNPVEQFTDFTITHNLPGDQFDATVEIFALNGQKVYAFSETVGSANGVVTQLRMDVNSLAQPMRMHSILVYRVVLQSKQLGVSAIGTGKLILKNQAQ